MSFVKLFLSVAIVVSSVAVGSANVIVNVRSDNGVLLRHGNEAVDAPNANVIVYVRSDDDVLPARNAYEVVDANKAVDVRTTYGCINNGDGCQPDGSQGTCCSGFCYKQPGWAAGYCK